MLNRLTAALAAAALATAAPAVAARSAPPPAAEQAEGGSRLKGENSGVVGIGVALAVIILMWLLINFDDNDGITLSP